MKIKMHIICYSITFCSKIKEAQRDKLFYYVFDQHICEHISSMHKWLI